MTLRPTDMLEIQSAIDAYERKFPRRPTPTAEAALEWRFGKKAWAQRQAAMAQADSADASDMGEVSSHARSQRIRRAAQPSGNGLVWLMGLVVSRWRSLRGTLESSEMFEDSAPLMQGVLRFGMWGAAAVLIVSVFLLGAIVGGFK
jgi:hypothetical protein